ncbi:MAG: Sel1 domain-containing protein repeat-containing protein [Rhodospirillaceae bacterium]|nr:MAG: Sel1 domain-containing protein repeat-containing protein [Rhodospirillaceae bacterium]
MVDWKRWGLIVGMLLLSDNAAATSLEEGITAYREGRYEAALPVLRQQAHKGDAEALFWLGQAFLKGQGVPFDYALAHEYFLRAARLGNRKAQNNIGMLHRDGLGVREDKITAYAWFSIAAAGADPPLLAAIANQNRLEVDLQPDQLRGRRRNGWSRSAARSARPPRRRRLSPCRLLPSRRLLLVRYRGAKLV